MLDTHFCGIINKEKVGFIFNQKIKIDMKLNVVDIIAVVLVVVGGLNWGLVGLADFDLVATLFGYMSAVSRIVYVLVGLAAVYVAVMAMKLEKR